VAKQGRCRNDKEPWLPWYQMITTEARAFCIAEYEVRSGLGLPKVDAHLQDQVVETRNVLTRQGQHRHRKRSGVEWLSEEVADRALERHRLAAGARPGPPGRGGTEGRRRCLGH